MKLTTIKSSSVLVFTLNRWFLDSTSNHEGNYNGHVKCLLFQAPVKAIYSTDLKPHYGLALQDIMMCHFCEIMAWGKKHHAPHKLRS
ncbi:hypothetical protein VNO77_35668 [Canavalia gladiata]|uniref:Uncharacterized protein n=1 Tax=Canavalia gladiata TaxID=3824 RepID=A0AAN9K701_CANGL